MIGKKFYAVGASFAALLLIVSSLQLSYAAEKPSTATPGNSSGTKTSGNSSSGGKSGTATPGNSGGNAGSAVPSNSSGTKTNENSSKAGKSDTAIPSNSAGKSNTAAPGNSSGTKTNENSSKTGKSSTENKGKSGAQVKSESVEDALTAEDLECGTTVTVTSGGSGQSAGKGNAATKKPATAGKSTTLVAEDCSSYIVVFIDSMSESARKSAISATKSKKVREFSHIFKGALIRGSATKIAALAKNPNVKYLEVDAAVHAAAVQLSAPWGLDRVDQRLLPLTSSFNDGDNSANGVSVYVVDTGINTSHSEFEGRLTAGYSSVAGGIEDCNGHGTHVAGTIAGRTYGIAKSATIVPVRVLDCAGSGTYSSVIAGLDWIAASAPSGVPAVVNMSLGGPASSTLDAAVKNLINRGISVVVAAGNSNTDACTASPARVAEAITVGGTTIIDSRASYSNFGTCLDLFAPGSAITSAWTGSASATNTINGTSMASPHVAGIIARFIAANPSLSPSQVASSLKSGATQGVIGSVGSGSVNLLAYLDFLFDGSVVTQPVEVPRTVAPGNSGKNRTSPGKKR